jgi:Family of unknown function (DUF5715)
MAGLVAVLLIAAGASVADISLVADAGSQRAQNERADADNLSRMANVAMIRRFVRLGLLVRVPASTRSYYVSGISPKYRYVRPWTRLFLDRLSRQFQARFGARLRVTGLIRTVAYQRALRGRNTNAAPALGPERSSHLTGATLDISKRFMKPRHKEWMRRVLYRLNEEDVIHAIEEFRQPTFHVMVYRSYRKYVRSLADS